MEEQKKELDLALSKAAEVADDKLKTKLDDFKQVSEVLKTLFISTNRLHALCKLAHVKEQEIAAYLS